MTPWASVALGVTFIVLAFALRGQPHYGRLGFVMMILAGLSWFLAAALAAGNF